jgi:hypothetical protein
LGLVASELYKEAMARSDLGSGSGTGDASCFSVVHFDTTFTSFSGVEKRTPLVLYVLVCVETPNFLVERMGVCGLDFVF